MSGEVWGKCVNRWHDEVGPAHLLREDGSPACGVRYYVTSGGEPDPVTKCRRCLRLKEKK